MLIIVCQQLNKEVCKGLGIERSLCAPYHPQTNGLVEKLNGTIQSAVIILLLLCISLWIHVMLNIFMILWTKNLFETRWLTYIYDNTFQGTVQTCQPTSRELGQISGCCDVWAEDQKTDDDKVLPILPPVWDRGPPPEWGSGGLQGWLSVGHLQLILSLNNKWKKYS